MCGGDRKSLNLNPLILFPNLRGQMPVLSFGKSMWGGVGVILPTQGTCLGAAALAACYDRQSPGFLSCC